MAERFNKPAGMPGPNAKQMHYRLPLYRAVDRKGGAAWMLPGRYAGSSREGDKIVLAVDDVVLLGLTDEAVEALISSPDNRKGRVRVATPLGAREEYILCHPIAETGLRLSAHARLSLVDQFIQQVVPPQRLEDNAAYHLGLYGVARSKKLLDLHNPDRGQALDLMALGDFKTCAEYFAGQFATLRYMYEEPQVADLIDDLAVLRRSGAADVAEKYMGMFGGTMHLLEAGRLREAYPLDPNSRPAPHDNVFSPALAYYRLADNGRKALQKGDVDGDVALPLLQQMSAAAFDYLSRLDLDDLDFLEIFPQYGNQNCSISSVRMLQARLAILAGQDDAARYAYDAYRLRSLLLARSSWHLLEVAQLLHDVLTPSYPRLRARLAELIDTFSVHERTAHLKQSRAVQRIDAICFEMQDSLRALESADDDASEDAISAVLATLGEELVVLLPSIQEKNLPAIHRTLSYLVDLRQFALAGDLLKSYVHVIESRHDLDDTLAIEPLLDLCLLERESGGSGEGYLERLEHYLIPRAGHKSRAKRGKTSQVESAMMALFYERVQEHLRSIDDDARAHIVYDRAVQLLLDQDARFAMQERNNRLFKLLEVTSKKRRLDDVARQPSEVEREAGERQATRDGLRRIAERDVVFAADVQRYDDLARAMQELLVNQPAAYVKTMETIATAVVQYAEKCGDMHGNRRDAAMIAMAMHWLLVDGLWCLQKATSESGADAWLAEIGRLHNVCVVGARDLAQIGGFDSGARSALIAMRMLLFVLQNDRTGYGTALMDWFRSWEQSRCQVRIARYNRPSSMVRQAHAIAEMLWHTNNFEAAKQFVDGCKLLFDEYEGEHSGNTDYFWLHLRKPLQEARPREVGSTPLSIETLRLPSKHTPDFVSARDADVDRMMDRLMEKGNILQNLEKMQNITGGFLHRFGTIGYTKQCEVFFSYLDAAMDGREHLYKARLELLQGMKEIVSVHEGPYSNVALEIYAKLVLLYREMGKLDESMRLQKELEKMGGPDWRLALPQELEEWL